MVIGSGGREHALAWKLAQSKKVEKIYAAPGNGGTASEEKTENLSLEDADPLTEKGQKTLLEFAKKNSVDLVVVGPEAPLEAGFADRFREAGLAVVGPGQKGARLETSKIYAKSFMQKYHVRTAKSKSFNKLADALEYAKKHFADKLDTAAPLVIKADGLAAGKGVVIAADFAEAKNTLSAFMKTGSLGEAGKSVVLEQFLKGREVSVMTAVNVCPGKTDKSGKPGKSSKQGVIKPFLSARDHKRRFEGGLGPNTGGMGAIAPVGDFTAAQKKDFETAILGPTLRGMQAEKLDYRGFIFFGLMIEEESCYLLEYNVRLGDPETQAVLPLMDSDFAELCEAIAAGNLAADKGTAGASANSKPAAISLADFPLKWKKGAVCAPVIAAEGYPGSYKSGNPIAINFGGLNRTGANLFIAGAKRGGGGSEGSGLRTSGGRVLAVSAFGNDADDAWEKAYDAIKFVRFEGMVYRRDIGREEMGCAGTNRDFSREDEGNNG